MTRTYAKFEERYVPIVDIDDVGYDEVRNGRAVHAADASFDHAFGTERVYEWEWDFSDIHLVWAHEYVTIPEFPIRHTYSMPELDPDDACESYRSYERMRFTVGEIRVRLDLVTLSVRRHEMIVAGETKLMWLHEATVTPAEDTP